MKLGRTPSVVSATLDRLAGGLDEAARRFERIAEGGERAVVFAGAGALGRLTAAKLAGADVRAVAFADNSPKVAWTVVAGLPVLPVAEAVRRHGSETIFVVTAFNTRALTSQLRNLGAPRVVPYAWLFARYPDRFLPYFCLDRPERLSGAREAAERGWSLFADDGSRGEYLVQLERRAFLDFDQPSGTVPPTAHAEEYFAPNLYSFLDSEILVDCGAYDGDTIERFRGLRKDRFEGIVALEPDPANVAALQRRLETWPPGLGSRVRVLEVAASDRIGTARFAAEAGVESSLSQGGAIEVRAVTIDSLFETESPTLLKMDVEGGELEALAGARRTIERCRPVLAVSVYHRPDHLWRIPIFVDEVAPGYRFHLRAHAEDCWDVCCYAVPEGRLPPTEVATTRRLP